MFRLNRNKQKTNRNIETDIDIDIDIDMDIDIDIIYFRNIRTMPSYDQLSMMNIIRMKITYQNKQRRCSVGLPYSIKLFTIADLISTVGQL
jgi:hypothetical protein